MVETGEGAVTLKFEGRSAVRAAGDAPIVSLVAEFFYFSIVILLFVHCFSHFRGLSQGPSRGRRLGSFQGPSLLSPRGPLQRLSRGCSLLSPPSGLSLPLRTP